MSSNANIKALTVKLSGKDYVQVAGRLLIAHDDNQDAMSIATDVTYEDADKIRVKATVTTRKGTYDGHAESYKKTGSAQEKKSPLEVAETSAVGRALGNAGYAIENGIASADEVENAIDRPSAPTSSVSAPTQAQSANATTKPVRKSQADKEQEAAQASNLATAARRSASRANEAATDYVPTLQCADCNKVIDDMAVGTGIEKAEDLARKTKRYFGRELCAECGAKAKAAKIG